MILAVEPAFPAGSDSCVAYTPYNRKNGGKGRLYLRKKITIVEGLYILYKFSEKTTPFCYGSKMA